MAVFHQLLGILVLGALSCCAEECITSSKWQAAEDKCAEELAKDDACFSNCAQEQVGALVDGHPTEDVTPNVLKKLIDDPELCEHLGKTATKCLSQVEGSEKCAHSKKLHECIWTDENFLEAVRAANYCPLAVYGL